MRASAAARAMWWEENCGRWGEQRRCSALRTLPQIAVWADTHFRVGKAVQAGRTYSGADTLGMEEREEEIAGMLGGWSERLTGRTGDAGARCSGKARSVTVPGSVLSESSPAAGAEELCEDLG